MHARQIVQNKEESSIGAVTISNRLFIQVWYGGNGIKMAESVAGRKKEQNVWKKARN